MKSKKERKKFLGGRTSMMRDVINKRLSPFRSICLRYIIQYILGQPQWFEIVIGGNDAEGKREMHILAEDKPELEEIVLGAKL